MLDSYLKELDKVYTEKIYPDLRTAEQIRKKILLNYTIIGTVLFSGMLVEAITWMSIAIVIIILFVLVYTRWYGVPVSKYENAYVHAITYNIIQFINPELQVDNSSHLKLIELKKSNIVNGDPEYFAGKNLIYGNINGQDIRISEITARTKYVKENGVEYNFQHFNGLVMVADFKPEISGTLLIYTGDQSLNDKVIGLRNKNITPNEQQVLTILSNDENATKKFATPQLLNNLKEFHLQTNKNIIYSATETGISLAILHDRRFTYLQPSVFSTAFNKKVVEIYYRDLRFLIGNLQVTT